MNKEIGITVKKEENFSEWYTQIVLKTELLDYAPVKGFIVLRPYGYAIWENLRKIIDERLKETGHANAFLPILIPESLLAKEAEHFQGFQPEVFWVTHTGNNKLSERLAVRPTSETLAYEIFGKWIRSYRDLPLKLNFWNTALRAEIKSTKPLIRNSEFLWQEGHTVHATRKEAEEEVFNMLNMYKEIIEQYLAIPVITGYKSQKEKFVGAEYTLSLETIMPDGKALQMGTSHNLAQNFSKVFNIKYLDKNNKEVYAWQTSWGISWRLIGAMIMVHGDDQGLIIPPKIAPIQLIIIPIYYKNKDRDVVIEKAVNIKKILQANSIRAEIDDREEYTPGYKFNEWEMKGVPLRIEIGPRDIINKTVIIARRDNKEKYQVYDDIVEKVKELINDIQNNLYNKAKTFFENSIHTASHYQQMKELIQKGGFVKAAWCGKEECEIRIKEEIAADIRVIPFNTNINGNCIYCNGDAKHEVYFAQAY